MPIDVTCEECFTPHRVKSEFAGRRFKCRECGATLVVPRKAAAAAPARSAAPPRAAAPSRAATAQKKRPARSGSKSRSRSNSPSWLAGPRVWILGGATLLLIIVMILVPRLLAILSLPLALAGIALAIWGALKCLAGAFEEDVTCGLMWIFVPFYSVFYTLTRWDRIGRYFLTFVGGLLLMWAPLYGVKLMASAQRAEMEPTFDAPMAEANTFPAPGNRPGGLPESNVADKAVVSEAPAEAAGLPGQPAMANVGAGSAATAGETFAEGSLGQPAPYGLVRGRRDLQPPPASVLDGRPVPRKFRPDEIPMFHPVQNPVEPGISVWINDRGWWYPGTVAELTDSPVRYMVRFEGWEDRPPQVANIAWIRERTPEAE